jgi:hypothetical protein
VGDSNKGASGASASGKRSASFTLIGSIEIKRKAGGENVPKLAYFRTRCMQFSADQRCKSVRTVLPRISDWPIKSTEKVFRKLDKVIASTLIGGDDLPRIKRSVGKIRVRMQVTPPETARCRKRHAFSHRGIALLPFLPR